MKRMIVCTYVTITIRGLRSSDKLYLLLLCDMIKCARKKVKSAFKQSH